MMMLTHILNSSRRAYIYLIQASEKGLRAAAMTLEARAVTTPRGAFLSAIISITKKRICCKSLNTIIQHDYKIISLC
jgi:hypothetical protein